ncbi:MAG TPA: hypothetical protein VGO00_15235 [Kofleriaceae bacterium]|jgi:hypothetical protein|nr:hypothetical protein [Kofleriaceae bacterium]
MIDPEAVVALVRRQRDFEWATTAARLRDQGHDLRNLIQIVELASAALRGAVGDELTGLVDELQRVAMMMKRDLDRREPGEAAPVGDAVRAAVELVRSAVSELVVTVRVDATTTTVLTEPEVEQLVLGLVLDGGRNAAAIDLLVRERPIAGLRWVELVCGIDAPPAELRAVQAMAERGGGEVTVTDRRGGGNEIAVALPAVHGS